MTFDSTLLRGCCLGAALILALSLVAPAGAQDTDLAESALDNGVIKVGINTSEYGGAITYLSLSDSERNLINNFDRGQLGRGNPFFYPQQG